MSDHQNLVIVLVLKMTKDYLTRVCDTIGLYRATLCSLNASAAQLTWRTAHGTYAVDTAIKPPHLVMIIIIITSSIYMEPVIFSGGFSISTPIVMVVCLSLLQYIRFFSSLSRKVSLSLVPLSLAGGIILRLTFPPGSAAEKSTDFVNKVIPRCIRVLLSQLRGAVRTCLIQWLRPLTVKHGCTSMVMFASAAKPVFVTQLCLADWRFSAS